jgi:hypothetical protein
LGSGRDGFLVRWGIRSDSRDDRHRAFVEIPKQVNTRLQE